MKIGLIHYSAPPAIGGVERIIGQQAKILSTEGHDVRILAGKGETNVDWPQVRILPGFGSKSDVRAALQDLDWVIVHNMFTMPFDWEASRELAELSRSLKSTRFINWVHDVDVSAEDFTSLQLVARHVAVSEERRIKFMDIGGMQDVICHVVPNGMDVNSELCMTSRVGEIAENLDLFQRDLVIFHPTRVVARKNLELGLRVARELLDQGFNVVYLVTGAPDLHRASSREYASFIQQLRNELDLNNAVQFLGSEKELDDEDIHALYRLSDLVFFPSKQEGFGLPLVESVLHRIPILCSDIPIHREVGGSMVNFFGLEDAIKEIASKCLKCLHPLSFSKNRRQLIHDLDWKQIYKTHLAPLIELASDIGE